MNYGDSDINKNCEILFDYLKFGNSEAKKADLIMVFCASDVRVARFASELYFKKLAPKILFSGGPTKYKNPELQKSGFNTEAGMFKAKAEEFGVPESDIIVEDQSTDSGSNIKLSYQKLNQLKLNPKTIIIVHKPYMIRRAVAALKKQWPDRSTIFVPACQNIGWLEYIGDLSLAQIESHINTMVGDLDRVMKYSEPKYNYQIHQDVPDEVKKAQLSLIKAGYNKRLL